MTARLVRRAAIAAFGFTVAWGLASVGAPAMSQADPCTDIPYYGCINIPNAPLPPTPRVPADIPVPAWTPNIDLCGPLGHRFTVGNICI